MLVSDIQIAVYDRIEAAVLNSEVIRTAKAREDNPFQAGNEMYAEVIIKPFDNQTIAYCGHLKSGFILVNVYAPSDSGAVAPTKEAERFLALFPEDLEFNGIKIPYTGNIKEPVTDRKNNGWFFVPTPILFEAN